MAWPQPSDYNAAVQNPASCFSDLDLKHGAPVTDPLGLPRPHAGNFADVYQIQGSNGQSWAVKCFTREVPGLALRYRFIAEHVQRARRAFLVDFNYLEQGIRIKGAWFPVLKMRWVEGFALNEFLVEHADQPAILHRLAALWLKLARELREVRIGHGDLQHGNVLLVPGSQASSLALRLIDYDGMWVPELAGNPSGELGHPNYQHPQRLREGGYGPEVDRFGLLAIYTALRAVAASGKSLWQRHDSGENLLFRETDFNAPEKSKLWPELLSHTDSAVRTLAGHLLLATRQPPDEVPLVDELVDNGAVRPLAPMEEAQVQALVPTRSAVAPPPLPRIPAPLPATPKRCVPARAAWMTPLLLGTGGIAMLALVALVVQYVLSSATSGEPPSSISKSPRLQPINAVVMRGGDVRPLTVSIDRGDCRDELTVTLDDLPERMTCPRAIVLPEQTSAQLMLTAAPRAEAINREVLVTLWANGSKVDTRRLPITVERLPLPTMKELAAVKITPGSPHEFDVVVDRQNCNEILSLRIDKLPADLIFAAEDLQPGATKFRVRLQALPTAPSAPHILAVTLYAGPYKAQEQLWQVLVEKQDETPKPDPLPRLVDAGTASLRVGDTGFLPIKLDRRGFDGPVEVYIDFLAPGLLESNSVTVPKGESEAKLPVQIGERATVGKHRLRLVGKAGDRKTAEFEIMLTILPARAMVQRPENSTMVRFQTVDQMELVGSLYRPTGRSKGTVLMLHDLGSNRAEAGWVHLAESLQAQGLDVLTFDFRGHGESTSIATPAVFWQYSANHRLKSYNPRLGLLDQPRSIKAADLDAGYQPWLVNDIVAARAYLDSLSTNGDLDVSNLIVIGAGQGASLGSLWLAGEHMRFRQLRRPFGTMGEVYSKDPEAGMVSGIVWLSFPGTIGTYKVDFETWMKRATRTKQALPIVLMYGGKDPAAERYATWIALFKRTTTSSKLTEAVPVPETEATGTKLLSPDLDTEKLLLARVKAFLETLRTRIGFGPRPGIEASAYVNGKTVVVIQQASRPQQPFPLPWFNINGLNDVKKK